MKLRGLVQIGVLGVSVGGCDRIASLLHLDDPGSSQGQGTGTHGQPVVASRAVPTAHTGIVLEGHPKPPADKPDTGRPTVRPEWHLTGQPGNPYPPGTLIPVAPPAPSTNPLVTMTPIPPPTGGAAGGQPTGQPLVTMTPIGAQPAPTGDDPQPAPTGDDPGQGDPAGAGTGAGAGATAPVTQSFEGDLGPGADVDAEGRFSRVHTTSFRRGQRVVITMEGTFDTFLRVEPPAGEAVENDDIAPDNLNSRVDFTAPIDGVYRIVATSYARGMTGHYTLRVSAGAPGAGMVVAGGAGSTGGAQPADAQTGAGGTLVSGTPVNEFLSPADPASGGRYVRAYHLEGHRGDMVTLTLASTAFDTTLAIVGPDGHRWFNDDVAPPATDSALTVTLPNDGAYRVEVSSFRVGASGPFTLTPTVAGRPTVNAQGAPTGGVAGRHATGSMYGVFVGITDYGAEGTLYGCADDARQLAQAYLSSHVGAPGQFIVLTDAEATRDAVRQAFATMAQRVGPNDVFMFFHSGHGNRRASTDRQADPDGSVESIVLRDGELTSHEVSSLFDPIRADENMLALDSCFSGGFERAFANAPNRFGMYSSEADVLSQVAQSFQAGGYLSYFLRRGVTEGDMDHDGVVRAGELAEYLHRQYAQHETQLGTSDGAGTDTWQHLVLNRSGIAVNDMLWRFPGLR